MAVSKNDPGTTIRLTRVLEAGAGGAYVLTHERIAREDLRKAHNEGWAACFNRVTAYLSQE